MTSFDVRKSPSVAKDIGTGLLLAVPLGGLAFGLCYAVPAIPTSWGLPIALALAVVVVLGMVLSGRRNTITRVWVDDEAFRIERSSGKVETHQRATNSFAPFLRQQQYQDKVTTIGRLVKITGLDGREKYVNPDLDEAEFSDLINALNNLPRQSPNMPL